MLENLWDAAKQREVYRDTGLLQEIRKISNKHPNLPPKGIRKRTTQQKRPKVSRRKEIKIREERI